MKICISGTNILGIILSIHLSISNPLWLIAIAVLISQWFVLPRWSKDRGWRFKYDD